MDRATARRGVLRVSTSVLLVGALLCFLLPFATVGCEETKTYQGIDFVDADAGDGSSDAATERQDALGSGAAPITLAIVFAGLGVALGLLPGLAAGAAAFTAAAAAAGALAAFLLTGSLRGFESLFVDFRYGFWPALAFSSAAAIGAWLRCETYPRVVVIGDRGRPVLAGLAGVAFLILAALVAQAMFAEEPESDPDILTGLPLSTALAPPFRRGEAWDAAAMVAVPFLAGVALLVLARQPSRLAGLTLVGLGAGWTLTAVQNLAYFVASDHYLVSDGTYLGLLGGLALVAAGLGARRSPTDEPKGVGTGALALVAVGTVAAIAGTAFPFVKDAEGNEIALLHGGFSATRWLALQPIVLALAALGVASLLPRVRAGATLLGMCVALLLPYVALLSPLTDTEEDGSTEAGIAAFIGAAGALVILAGALLALRRRSASPEP